MTGTSKTGLQSGVRRRVPPPLRRPQRTMASQGSDPVQLVAEARPAPFVLRPFAGFYNPFPYGCSVLCNHPADCEARDLVKRAKEAWGASGGVGPGTACSPLGHLAGGGGAGGPDAPYADGEPAVPEALFRRYTDTDSRPQTPAPTLASSALTPGVVTGVMAVGRRCMTPDAPLSASGSAAATAATTSAASGQRSRGGGERPLLVLDLRRSLSQEALSWRGLGSAGSAPGGSSHDSPVASASPTRDGGSSNAAGATTSTQRPGGRPAVTAVNSGPVTARRPPPGRPRRANPASTATPATPAAGATDTLAPELDGTASDRADSPSHSGHDVDSASADEGSGRRRGKRRRRRKRGDSDGATEPAVQGLPDPQVTQVSTLDSGHPGSGECGGVGMAGAEGAKGRSEEAVGAATEEPGPAEPAPPAASFIDATILRQLQRELVTADVLDFEFNHKRRVALAEAMRVRGLPPPPERACAELRRLHRALAAAAVAAVEGGAVGPDRWLTIPRVASRSSARFDLPMDSRQLLKLSPLQYLTTHVWVGTGRQMLFRLIFERHSRDRRLHIENVESALTESLGFAPTPEVRSLSCWDAAAARGLSFRQWAGVAALAERLAASATTAAEADPALEVERVDLASLETRLRRLQQPLPAVTTPRDKAAAGAKATDAKEENTVAPVVALLRAVRDA